MPALTVFFATALAVLRLTPTNEPEIPAVAVLSMSSCDSATTSMSPNVVTLAPVMVASISLSAVLETRASPTAEPRLKLAATESASALR